MPKVFVPNKSAHDYSPAEHYGELIYVTVGRVGKYSTDAMARSWAQVLVDSKPEDIILISGFSHLNAIGCGMFAVMHEKLNLLLFRGGINGVKYIFRQGILLKQALEAEEEEQRDGRNKN